MIVAFEQVHIPGRLHYTVAKVQGCTNSIVYYSIILLLGLMSGQEIKLLLLICFQSKIFPHSSVTCCAASLHLRSFQIGLLVHISAFHSVCGNMPTAKQSFCIFLCIMHIYTYIFYIFMCYGSVGLLLHDLQFKIFIL